MKTQRDLVLMYIKIYGAFCPAKKANTFFASSYHFGSEIGRVCRKLRKEGILKNTEERDDGYVAFCMNN